MLHLDTQTLSALLPYPALIAALKTAFCSDVVVPVRHHHEIAGNATHLIMPAWSAAAPAKGAYLGTKLVNVFSDNAALGLPSIAGLYILQSGETGVPLCTMDGAALTARRTAAVSALAASFLAREDASHLLMIGAGALAPQFIAAHRAVRPLRKLTLWNRNRASSEKLAALPELAGLTVSIADDLPQAVAEADMISTATLAREPIIFGQWLKPGCHLDLVGAFNLHMREVDDLALRRSHIVIDTPAALSEGGDVALALRAGAISRADIAGDLSALCKQIVPGRQKAEEITLFKSVGSAGADLAAAILAWERSKKP